jgi:hypothetical protein
VAASTVVSPAFCRKSYIKIKYTEGLLNQVLRAGARERNLIYEREINKYMPVKWSDFNKAKIKYLALTLPE